MNDRGLHETEIAVRNVMPEESTIDLDLHARAIAAVAIEARLRARAAHRVARIDLAGELLDHVREPRLISA